MRVNKERINSFLRNLMLIIITAVVTFSITSILLYRNGKIKYIAISNGDTTGLGTVLTSFKSLLDDRYLYDMDEEKMVEAAIKAYVDAAGDEYTEYFTKEEMESFTTYTTGNYVGIGIYMMADTSKNVIVVTSPIKNGPAEKAGIKSGDIISKVDGVSYDASQLSELASKIKGESGTTVELEIIRDDETINVMVERKKIELYPIEATIIEDNIAYIPVESFDEGAGELFKKAWESVSDKNVKGLVIDLRTNGGGIVDEALEMANLILDKGDTILITVDKNNNEDIEKSQDNPVINVPIVVLIDGETASASEMLAGALQDNDKAMIVGENSYGKGVIQELYTLKDGSGLKVTVKEYYTPNRNKINKIGIKPDYEVKDDETTTDDEQLQKAVEVLKSL